MSALHHCKCCGCTPAVIARVLSPTAILAYCAECACGRRSAWWGTAERARRDWNKHLGFPPNAQAPCACPFCGATERDHDPEAGTAAIELQSCAWGEQPKVFYAFCNVCGAQGPLCHEGAVAMQKFFYPNNVVRGAALGPRTSPPPCSALNGGGK
jgi:hypothetical protein